MSISLCMIAKNEENFLGKCLNSVKSIADEIIVVDAGSTDKTKKIAKKFKRNPTPPVTDWRIARSLRSLGRISKNTNIPTVGQYVYTIS